MFEVAEDGVHECGYFFVVGLLVDETRRVEGDDVLEGFKRFVCFVLFEQFEGDGFFSTRLLYFLVELHVEAVSALGEVVDSNYEIDSVGYLFFFE